MELTIFPYMLLVHLNLTNHLLSRSRSFILFLCAKNYWFWLGLKKKMCLSLNLMWMTYKPIIMILKTIKWHLHTIKYLGRKNKNFNYINQPIPIFQRITRNVLLVGLVCLASYVYRGQIIIIMLMIIRNSLSLWKCFVNSHQDCR